MSVVAGKYEACLRACSTIELTPNGRFEAVINGDLFNNIRARGSWTVDPNGHVLLNSDQQPRIMERIAPVGGGIRFRVVDQTGNWPEIVTVSLTCPAASIGLSIAEGRVYPQDPNAARSVRLESDGFGYVDGCRPSEFRVEIYSQHSVRYRPIDRASNEFVFALDTNSDFYITNEKYLWKPGYLHAAITDESGGGWSEFPLKLKEAGNSSAVQHAAGADSERRGSSAADSLEGQEDIPR